MEFIQAIDSGGLKYPDQSVVTFVINCHYIFENLPIKKKKCRNYLIQTFEMVDDVFDTKINDDAAYRCLANILMNNFSKSLDWFYNA